MTSSLDEFARSFDSIPVDRKAGDGLPEEPLAFGEVHSEFDDTTHPYAGYSLLDDAGGRFIIDRETGVITLLHDDLLATDSGGVYGVRVRCVEYSGISYDLQLKLKISGRVPQIAGSAEENVALANLALGTLNDDAQAHTINPAVAVAAPPPEAWTRFAAFQNHAARRPLRGEAGPYGALLAADLPAVSVVAERFTLGVTPPAPTSATVDWRI